MIKAVIVCISLLIPISMHSQTGTLSPYSLFGIGDTPANTSTSQSGFGFTNLAIQSNAFINFSNPATQTALLKPTFAFDLKTEFLTLNNGQTAQSNALLSIENFAFGFPLINNEKKKRRAALSLGLTPRSKLGYEVLSQETIPDFGTVQYLFYGNGGLGTGNLGLAYDLLADSARTQTLSLGVTVSYVFGNLSRNSVTITDSNILASDVFRKEESEVSDVDFRVGLLYAKKLKFTKEGGEETTGTLRIGGFVYPSNSLNAFRTRETFTFIGDYLDPFPVDSLSSSKSNTTLDMPLSFGGGVSFDYNRQWLIGADVTITDWSEYGIGGVKEGLNDELRTSLGVEFIPDYTSFKSLLKIIRYRAGFSFEQTRINVNGARPNRTGFHAGVGIPIAQSKSSSMFNLGTEYAIRGGGGLPLNEQYWNLYFGLTITPNQYDRWFAKRKYD